ncbi:hypothetical protein [Streptomyces sp. UNOC14_S4]|uniref:hypothetical protein n=1 Tax=Streptomyces sp. UNOC14_S4 TaxID=2872340 RepID=UPI001E2DEC36|nr:hypothetical protein [Streptomyces sp. UNOC14_S4]MCC3768891.1 hypothetical protein [Streptomyces sp. UNOC14_S4]
MTDPHQRLQDALDALDTAFAPFIAQPFTPGGCTYCYTEEDFAALAGHPDQVPEDLVGLVAFEGSDHWDDFHSQYRRMTPRIVRLMVTGEQVGPDHSMVASRLVTAEWRDWPRPEREALEAVWHAWWRKILHEHPGTESVFEALEVISMCMGTLEPWLTIWAGTRTEAADRHLFDMLEGWLFEWDLAFLEFGFYNELDAASELVPWLLSLEEGRIDPLQLAEFERMIAYADC